VTEVDDPFISQDAFYDGMTYKYVAVAAGTPSVAGGTNVTTSAHGAVNGESAYDITSSTPITSITIPGLTQSTFRVHHGSLFFDGTWDPTPTSATHAIPEGQSLAWGIGLTEDLGTSNWYASVDGVQTAYSKNVREHVFSMPIAPLATHTVMGAGYTSGGLGIQAAYWGYSDDGVSCP
jgi:hypothetical protein